MRKTSIIVVALCVNTIVSAQKIRQLPDIKSNTHNIEVWQNGGYNNWQLANESHTFDFYSVTKKYLDIKIKTDIDSVEFKAKKNELTSINVIINNVDTFKYSVNLTDKFENTLSKEQKIYALSLFWSDAKYNFAFIDKLKFNLDSLYTAYIPKITNTKNDFEFYRQMKLFAYSLKDLHTEIYYYKESTYTKFIPLTAKYFDNDLYIVSTYDNPDLPPIKSKILKINDLPIAKYMQKEIIPFINSDFEPTAKNMSASKLFGSDLVTKKMKITYKTPENNIFTKTLSRYESGNLGTHIGYQFKHPRRLIEIEWQKNDIALLKINSFDPTERLISAFEKMKDTLYSAKGIIIDIRQNGGGETNAAWYFLQHIIKDKYFLNFAYQTRINNGVKKATGNFIEGNEAFYKNQAYETFLPDTIYIPDSIKQFDCPIVILISNNTCSAAEDFLIILKERPDRPLFIGQPTMGSTGSPLVLWDFPGNAMARICARRVLYPYSLKPYTEGIFPDIQVDYTLDEFINQDIDKEIDVAVKELEKQIKK
jgi:C-terminal processing protease CtpA/Prc